MASKKKPARMPRPFKTTSGSVLAQCFVSGNDRRWVSVHDGWQWLNSKDTTRFAAWMARAAAWCSEEPRKKERKQ